MTATASLQTEFLDRFRLRERIGGVRGEVYAADAVETGERVAVRVVGGLSPQLIRIAQAQAERALGVRHPIIANLNDFAAVDDRLYLASEFVQGSPIDRWLSATGAPAVPVAVELVQRLCAGLSAAHQQGVHHEALMPHNLCVLPFTFGAETRLALKVLDVGLPILHARPPLDVHQAQFLAPEQLVPVRGGWTSVAGLGEASSVYTLGALLFFLCAGHRPYQVADVQVLEDTRGLGQPPDLCRVAPHVPAGLGAIATRAMARDPQARFLSLAAMADALAAGAPEGCESDRRSGSARSGRPRGGGHGLDLSGDALRELELVLATGLPANEVGTLPRVSAIRPAARLRTSRAGRPADTASAAVPSAPVPMSAPRFEPAAPCADDAAFEAEVEEAITRTLLPAVAAAAAPPVGLTASTALRGPRAWLASLRRTSAVAVDRMGDLVAGCARTLALAGGLVVDRWSRGRARAGERMRRLFRARGK